MDPCPFCKDPTSDPHIKPTVVLTEKGCSGIRKAKAARGSSDDIEVKSRQIVHVDCRKQYTNPKAIETSKRKALPDNNDDDTKCTLRSESPVFSYKENCLFCGLPEYQPRKIPDCKLVPVRSHNFRTQIIQACEQYEGDWVKTVKAKLAFTEDLPAADAKYHQLCNSNFRTGRRIPYLFQELEDLHPKKRRKSNVGRPKDSLRVQAFEKVTKFLEGNDDEQLTVNDLINKMGEFLKEDGLEPYSFPCMKKEIQNHFGNKIIISEVSGKANVVTLYTSASRILQEFHEKDKKTETDEKNMILEAAAKFIKQDIKDIKQDRDLYPDTTELSTDAALAFIPPSLQVFLQHIICGDNLRKVACIGQALMQASRPCALLAPLQLGLGVEMHYQFQSKFLIDTLHVCGYSCPYSEVRRYEQSAAVGTGPDLPEMPSQCVLQFAADNVDHNLRTLDGKGTFHGMGMIAMFTPATKRTEAIKKVKVTSKDISQLGKIKIHNFWPEKQSQSCMYYEYIKCLNANEPHCNVDLLWKTSLLFKLPRPNWSGFSQLVHQGFNPGKSSVVFLPMIDMDPNDLSCIYSALKFIRKQASNHKCTPVITFDQPLWWKAHTMVESTPELQPAVIRLGGFHTQMSFLGCIGHLMGGSGLHELLEVVYATNAVTHMLSGKAVSRAVRGHTLADASLNTILIASALDVELPVTDESVMDGILPSERDLIKGILSGTTTIEDIDMADLSELVQKLSHQKEKLKEHKTAALWLQYMAMIDLLKKIIKAERLGDWQLHLQSLYDMLPYFAASGHNLYLKSVHLYLQKMAKLESDHPVVYQHFIDGNHVIRRSDRLWGGLSTDLVIEQCLMRSLKTRGGLTRGGGMTESQRHTWVMSMPSCAELNFAMQDFTGATYVTSEQHKEATKTRIERDIKDTDNILEYLLQRNPFTVQSESLTNIATGMTTSAAVSAERAKDIGHNILQKIVSIDVFKYTFKKKDQCVTMETKSTVRIKDEDTHIDPQLLFQRLITVGARDDEISTVFSHELCAYPSALFKSKSIMLLADKPSLANDLLSRDISSSDPMIQLYIFLMVEPCFIGYLGLKQGFPTFLFLCTPWAFS